MITSQPACDYLRLGSFDGDLIAAFHRYVMAGEDLELGSAAWLQYRGVRVGEAFAGVADQGGRLHGLLDVSGRAAESAVHSGWAGVPSCSRIDLQLTLPVPPGYRARDMVDVLRAADWPGGGYGRGQRRAISMIEGDDGLDTVYIGSRSSERFIRVYVKEDDVGGRWLRFEIEYKNDKAKMVYALLVADRDAAASILLGEWESLPAVTELAAFGEFLRAWQVGIYISVPRVMGDSTTAWRWFAETVAPFLQRMVNDHDVGNKVRFALIDILGGGDGVTPLNWRPSRGH